MVDLISSHPYVSRTPSHCLLNIPKTVCSVIHASWNQMIQVLSWNIQNGEGVDGIISLERIADTIFNISTPDVICLQEVSRNCKLKQDARSPARPRIKTQRRPPTTVRTSTIEYTHRICTSHPEELLTAHPRPHPFAVRGSLALSAPHNSSYKDLTSHWRPRNFAHQIQLDEPR